MHAASAQGAAAALFLPNTHCPGWCLYILLCSGYSHASYPDEICSRTFQHVWCCCPGWSRSCTVMHADKHTQGWPQMLVCSGVCRRSSYSGGSMSRAWRGERQSTGSWQWRGPTQAGENVPPRPSSCCFSPRQLFALGRISVASCPCGSCPIRPVSAHDQFLWHSRIQ